MTDPQRPVAYYQPHPSQQHVPYYEGPPAATFETQPALPSRRSRAPFVAAGVAVAAVVTVGAALIVARPWHHDRNALPVSPVAQASTSPSGAAPQPRHKTVAGPALDHTAVEELLIDLEDATAPVCNGGDDIAAKVGKTFTCVESSQKWTVRITEVQADGGVRYELVD